MPIPIEQRITSIVFSLLLLFVIIQLIRRHKLREQYALIWLAAGVTIFLLSLFHNIVGFMATVFAVSYPPTLILVLGLLFVLVIMLSQSVVLSSQANRIRDLAQDLALLKWRLDQSAEEPDQADSVTEPGTNGTSQPKVEKDPSATANGLK